MRSYPSPTCSRSGRRRDRPRARHCGPRRRQRGRRRKRRDRWSPRRDEPPTPVNEASERSMPVRWLSRFSSKHWQTNGNAIERQEGASVKKFVNDPKEFVPEMLRGIALANPDALKYVPEYNLIMRADAPYENKVSIVQGSGSGHEPAHVMIVGKGMLDAACPGDVFAAPPMDYVLETTKLFNSKKGVLHRINNYTGDRMAFDMGAEMAEAEGITIGTVIVDDDVAVKDSTWTVGRRGVAGNF